MIDRFDKNDIWKFVTYTATHSAGETERWKLKAYNNLTNTAYVVFKCNNKWESFQNYTSEACSYSELSYL